jgi:hypothetical protein
MSRWCVFGADGGWVRYLSAIRVSWEGRRVRKILGPILIGLGGFLLVAGLLATLWVPGAVKKTPGTVNSTTRLSGTVQKLDTSTGQLATHPVKVTSVTQTDTKASTDEVNVWVNKQCVVFNDDGNTPDCVAGTDPRLVTASIDQFATDRVTALSIPDFPALPDSATPHEGLVNKWPFDAQKKTYPYWEGTLGRSVDAVYDRTATTHGVEAYVYKVQFTDQKIDIAKGLPGTYDDSKEIWIEPATGSIIKQVDNQQRYLADGSKVLDLKASYTEAQVAKDSQDAKDSRAQLNLLTKVVPVVGIVGGLLLIALGVLLLVLGRRRDQRRTEPTGAVPMDRNDARV